ncbi:S8 family peptidase [Flavobacterium flavipallidum]|uniref:S8 family peptidase n=1 Tax=Flavobacterium flavipallidum TaxID=3139140 RepID=A0ABU9HIR7_9FLAO
MSDDFKPHLFIKNVHFSQEYTTPPGPPIESKLPQRDRQFHGEFLLSSLTDIWNNHNEEVRQRTEKGLPVKSGEYITFIGAEKQLLELSSLGADGAKLLNVKNNSEQSAQIATVFIPSNKQNKLITKVAKYLSKDTVKGLPLNQKLVEKIEYIQRTTVEYIWNSSNEFLPKEAAVWCELWLALEESEIGNELTQLYEICEFLNISVLKNLTIFPQRLIINAKLNYDQLVELTLSFGWIAEIRRAEELNSFWLDQTIVNRENWIESALSNITFNNSNNYISILDSGINNGHLLIKDALSDNDRLTVDINWGINDSGHNGHGTAMAGISLYGNLSYILENNASLEIRHRLESIKILPPSGQENELDNWHFITQNAINIAITNNPDYKRIFGMAITGRNQNDFGKPSTWSAYLDRIIFGEDENDKKVFVISAGNAREEDDWKNYPESNKDLSVESPAQAWNAITIGAFTNKILPEANSTVAKKFELSPYSRTSSSWENPWPIKPEVVFEGGNLKKLENGSIDYHEDLDILTTSSNTAINAFARFNATSVSTAFASNFLAKLRDAYPNAWPETLRALMIHSASWNSEIINQFNIDLKKVGDKQRLLRIIGYGIPNLEKAIKCKSNYLTFISEEVIQPYKFDGTVKTNEIHYYEFPWPTDILANLGDSNVTLRVTLSYYIEPNPGDKGYSTKYAYQSCALKFLLINPTEDFDNFKIRTNKINIDNLKEEKGGKLEEGDYDKNQEKRWFLGAETVFKGSIHSNFWNGSAAEIAVCNKLAIFPLASGWWKLLKKQKKYDSQLRYSLIVSIETPENTTDIYTPIATQVAVENLIVV